jgi:G3E family GTPase
VQTTLVKYILEEQHGHRIAVILNEFGEETGIESAFVQDGQVRLWQDFNLAGFVSL